MTALTRLDARPIPDDPDEIRGFLVVRNESLRLPANIRHHRALGVNRFFVVDNGSSDGSLEFLLAQPDTHVFTATGSYSGSQFGMDWCNALLEAYGVGHWTLTIDADELFVYDRCEIRPLQALRLHLEAGGSDGVFCLLLDMYSDQPLTRVVHQPDGSLLEACRYFDPAPYRLLPAQAFPHLQIYGGARERLLQSLGAEAPHPPTISKIPFVRWRAGMRYLMSAHAITPIALGELTGALLHFKFLSDFPARVDMEVSRGEHFNGASEYRAYAAALAREGGLQLFHAASRRYDSSGDLTRLKLMTAVDFEGA